MIDTTRPEDYEIETAGQWRQVVCIFEARGCDPDLQYGVILRDATKLNGYDFRWRGADGLREKPKWEPMPGKVYVFWEDDPEEYRVGLYEGHLTTTTLGRVYLMRSGPGFGTIRSLHCRPLTPDEIGE